MSHKGWSSTARTLPLSNTGHCLASYTLSAGHVQAAKDTGLGLLHWYCHSLHSLQTIQECAVKQQDCRQLSAQQQFTMPCGSPRKRVHYCCSGQESICPNTFVIKVREGTAFDGGVHARNFSLYGCHRWYAMSPPAPTSCHTGRRW